MFNSSFFLFYGQYSCLLWSLLGEHYITFRPVKLWPIIFFCFIYGMSSLLLLLIALSTVFALPTIVIAIVGCPSLLTLLQIFFTLCYHLQEFKRVTIFLFQ